MPNQLANEHSPYLQEHAGNPVDWFAWNTKTLELAKTAGKPILLSIGYSACHWCHVMAYESFEDLETATLMNELFINIKVDREERPDLDKIFQLSHQLITQRPGGWPLTVFLTPDEHMPFFAGTYFPKEESTHSVSFKQVLQHVASAYHDKKDDIAALSAEMKQAFSQLAKASNDTSIQIDDSPIGNAFHQLKQDFDESFGGFGEEPKFPHPIQCDFLLENLSINTNKMMLEKTLDHMALGGIFDQIGGGFFRYTVDRAWEIPHFEKMLYDSAQLIPVYAKAHQIFQKPLYKKVALKTAHWMIQNMQAQNGGFYATLNADSEGIEGLFYTWDKEDIKNLVSKADYQNLCVYFNLNEPANFENKWHLHVADQTLFTEEVELACNTLQTERKKRIPPSKDEKILTSWNGLAIKGLVITGLALKDQTCLDAAEKALNFCLKKLYQDQRLAAVCKDDFVYLQGYLDDYAFLLEAILTFLEYKWSLDLLNTAKLLADTLCKHFLDQDHHLFFFTADDQETVIERQKILLDDAMPAGNSIATQCLLRLSHILSEPKMTETVTNALKAAWEYLSTFPAAHCSLLTSLQQQLTPPTMIFILGQDAGHWQAKLQAQHNSHTHCFAITTKQDCPKRLLDQFPGNETIGLICKAFKCEKMKRF